MRRQEHAFAVCEAGVRGGSAQLLEEAVRPDLVQPQVLAEEPAPGASGTTNASGVFTATLASTTAETKTVSALVDGAISVSSNVNFGCVLNAAHYPKLISGSTYGLGDLAFNSGCDVLGVTYINRTVYRIDAVSGAQTTVASNVGSSGLLGIAYRPADNTIYVSSSGNGAIHAISPSGTATLYLSHSAEINALAIAPANFGVHAGRLIGVTSSGTVISIDPAGPTATTLATAGGRLSDLAFSDAGFLYVANQSTGAVQRVTTTGTVTQVASVPDAEGVVVDAAKNRLYVANGSSNTLHQVDLTTGAVTTLGSYDFDDGYFVSGMLLDSTGKLLLGLGETSQTLQLVTPP